MAGNAKAIAQASLAGLPNLGDLMKQAVAAEAEANLRKEVMKAKQAQVQAEQTKKLSTNMTVLESMGMMTEGTLLDLISPKAKTPAATQTAPSLAIK